VHLRKKIYNDHTALGHLSCWLKDMLKQRNGILFLLYACVGENTVGIINTLNTEAKFPKIYVELYLLNCDMVLAFIYAFVPGGDDSQT